MAPTLPLPVIEANTRKLRMIFQSDSKNDRLDAEQLARIARSGFCDAVSVRSEAGQMDRLLLKARGLLVRQRRAAQNAIPMLWAKL